MGLVTCTYAGRPSPLCGAGALRYWPRLSVRRKANISDGVPAATTASGGSWVVKGSGMPRSTAKRATAAPARIIAFSTSVRLGIGGTGWSSTCPSATRTSTSGSSMRTAPSSVRRAS